MYVSLMNIAKSWIRNGYYPDRLEERDFKDLVQQSVDNIQNYLSISKRYSANEKK